MYEYIYVRRYARHYGMSNFVGDTVLTFITCGFWLIWIVIREIRMRSRPYQKGSYMQYVIMVIAVWILYPPALILHAYILGFIDGFRGVENER